MAKIGPAAGLAVDEKGAHHAFDVLRDAKDKGAGFLVGGPEFVGRTSLKPTIVTGVTPQARIWDEETFGPSATLYVVEDDAEAVARANDSAYGLNAAVHTKDWERGLRVARKLEYGQVHINSMTVGGTGESCRSFPPRGLLDAVVSPLWF